MAPLTVEELIQRREAVLAQVRTLLIDNLNVRRTPEEIDPDAPLFGTGLGLDSVDAVELAVGLEGAFGVRLPEDASSRRWLRTVNTLVDLVLAHPQGLTQVPHVAA